MSFIENSLEGLKTLLNDDGTMLTIADQGTIQKVKCTFNSPANESDIERLENELNVEIPRDLKDFLIRHNGAKLYELFLGEINIGGGLEIYSLEEINKAKKNFPLEESFYLSAMYSIIL